MTYMIAAESTDGEMFTEDGESVADAKAILESLPDDLIMLHVIMACEVEGEAHTLNRIARDDPTQMDAIRSDGVAWLVEHAEAA